MPPIVKRNTNPKDQSRGASKVIRVPWRVANQEKILIPVGTAITIVAAVKYARVSTSMPTVNIWWAHTIKPNRPMANIA